MPRFEPKVEPRKAFIETVQSPTTGGLVHGLSQEPDDDFALRNIEANLRAFKAEFLRRYGIGGGIPARQILNDMLPDPPAAPVPVEATAPEDHFIAVRTEVVERSASSAVSMSGERWDAAMAVGAVASLIITTDDLMCRLGAQFDMQPGEFMARVAAMVQKSKAPPAPKVELAPAGFDPRRLRLTRDSDGPRTHPPGA